MANVISTITMPSDSIFALKKTLYLPVFKRHSTSEAERSGGDFGVIYIGKYTAANQTLTHIYKPYTTEQIHNLGMMLMNKPGDSNYMNYPPTPGTDFTSSNDCYLIAAIYTFEDSDGNLRYKFPFGGMGQSDAQVYYKVVEPKPTTSNITDYVDEESIEGNTWADTAPGSPYFYKWDFDVGSGLQGGVIKAWYRGSQVIYMGGSLYTTTNGLDPAVIDQNIADYLENYTGDPADLPEITSRDPNNPYGDTEDGVSGPGGGDGDGTSGESDPVDFPSLPSLSASNSGFITMYNPSTLELKQLANYMWSSSFDVDQLQKLFADPMEGVIGLSIVPIQPSVAGSIPVMIGNATTPVSMQMISTQFVSKDFGSVKIEPYVKSFLDYDPYTKIQIYLPYVGLHDLSADDVMGETINVKYHIDVVTGGIAAMIKVGSKGVLYQYNGNCATNVPITANNFSSAIQNAISTVISAGSMAAGMATGAAPLSAMGAMGLINSAANTAVNSKAHIQRSGNMGGSAGLMSIQKPYIIIQRPHLSVPSQINTFVGNTSNITASLSNCNGFTMVEYIHLHGISATDNELKEIETLLKGGVIL